MKKKKWILPGLAAFLVVAGFLAIGFSSRASVQKQKNKATCCQKMKECKDKAGSSVEAFPDNLSSQFLSILLPGR